ncbi:unnamed protein product [Plutella xylostella]|uniref:(diamondback moth) hypothetical protein n=1 Tax=Plutella xylostella TaxID=51655 RepID=A0A8S4DVS8_PLUXY|nr:unnamed protein product [Plutella xylostella]
MGQILSESPTCGGHCCGRGREGALRAALRRHVGARAAASTRPVADLLLATRRTLQEHLTELSHQSQNKTAIFFTQMYKGYASRALVPLATLFQDIRLVLSSAAGEDFEAPPPRDLAQSARKFFGGVFPVVYHHVLKLDGKWFTPEYEACVWDVYELAQPFGEVPHQFGGSLSRSLEGARSLLQALALGAGALAAGEQVLARGSDDACGAALLRAAGCSHCRGHGARPCRNYCLNVARGCIGSLVSELEAPWAGYVEGVERLARATDADAALRALDTRVSEAVMHALENHAVLVKKVRQECGAPSTTADPHSAPHVTSPPSRRDVLRAPPPDTQLLQFAATLAANKKLFAAAADSLCDEDLADEDNEGCWNGDSVGIYSKALVASSSLSDQRYNPEVAGGAPQDPQVAVLADRLRQARQVLISHTSGGAPVAESFMQGDEAGDGDGAGGEGSGSGRSADDDYDAEGSGDEGSGHGIEGDTRTRNYPIDASEPKVTGSRAAPAPLAAACTLALLAALSRTLT